MQRRGSMDPPPDMHRESKWGKLVQVLGAVAVTAVIAGNVAGPAAAAAAGVGVLVIFGVNAIFKS